MNGVGVIAILVIACVPLGAWAGVHIGRTWSSLPTLRVHSTVAFRGPEVGLERHLTVSEIHVRPDGTTVVLTEATS